MEIDDESFSIIFEEIEQGLKDQLQMTDSFASSTTQADFLKESTHSGMEEVSREHLPPNPTAYPTQISSRDPTVVSLHLRTPTFLSID